MPISRRPVPALLAALVSALLLLPAGGPAVAATQGTSDALLAHERYLSSFGTTEPAGPTPEERYYSSFGAPESLTAPERPAPAGETPWLPLGAGIGGAVAILALTATGVRRRGPQSGRLARRPTGRHLAGELPKDLASR